MSEQRFNIQQQYRQKFYQLPKVFFTNDKYIQLSNDAKIAYALLKDRLELSIKNNWFDENGDIFFIYTNENLKTILNCHKAKLIKIKKELTEADLLEQIRCGQGKPNKLYLMNPEITKEDIYEIKKQEESTDEHRHDGEVRKSNFKKFANQTSRSSKNKPLEVRKSNTNDTDFSDTDFSDTDFSDTTTNKKQCGSSNKWIEVIKNDLNITMTKKYTKELAVLLTHFNDEVITYAIEHTSLYAKNPKPFLLKILKTWKQANVKTVDNAIDYKVSKDNVVNFNREKTPEWLIDQEKQEDDYLKDNENDEQFEKERKAFIEKLKEDWGD